MRFTIKTKLGLTFATIIVLSMVTAILGINSLASLDSNLESLVEGPVQRLQIAQDVFTDLLMVVRAQKNIVLANSPEEIDRFSKDDVTSRQALMSQLDKGESIASAEGKPKWAGIRTSWTQFVAVDDKVADLSKHGDRQKAEELSSGQARQLVGEVQKLVEELIVLQRKLMTEARAEASASV